MQQQTFTRHATERMQQRGFCRDQVGMLVDLADLYTPIGRAMGALRVSRSAVAEAVADGLSGAAAERLGKRVAVVADDGAIVTLTHLFGRKAASYRRRDRRAYWR